LNVGLSTYISREDLIKKFGAAPDGFKALIENRWNEVKDLIDWILNNTEYHIAGVTGESNSVGFYFTK
jgi:hypothetical protein